MALVLVALRCTPAVLLGSKESPRHDPTPQLMAVMLAAATSWTGHLVVARRRQWLNEKQRALPPIERRFDPLPLRDGINLRPKIPCAVRSIENTGIAVDGTAVTGAELRHRIGTTPI